jgi:glycosyltransferase involved in cell wall biosynthesis
LVAIGNISTRKNLVTLVQGLARTDPNGPPLVLAGKPHSSFAALQEEIERRRLDKRIIQIGFAPDEDLPALIQGARALVHPSIDEGFGFPPLEAMASGTPVIAAHAGSLPEIVGDAGLLLPAHDPDAWAHAIDRITIDDDLHHQLSTAGPTQAQPFTWERTAQKTLDVYHQTLP